MVIYHRPRTLDQALHLLAADPTLKVLAGATDIYPVKTARAGWGQMQHPDVVDLGRIPGLTNIDEHADYWEFGAMTTWSALVTATLPPLFDGLKAAALEIGGIQIQNRGTIAGNICTASPAGDSIPCLLALDASVQLTSANGERVLPLSSFISGYRRTVLDASEIVTAIHVPKQTGAGHFLKLGARRYLVISIAMVSGVFDQSRDGTIRSAKIAVGACSAVAQRLPVLERRLLGLRPDRIEVVDHDLAHLAPIDDIRASGAYRLAAARQLVADLLSELGAATRRIA